MSVRVLRGLMAVALLMGGVGLSAQEQGAPLAAPATEVPAEPAAAPAVPVTPVIAAKVEAKKKGKDVYTGPTEIVTLPPTPMLDEEGKQRLDTDGKPMWNAAVKQQRDKRGHPVFDEKGKPVFQTASEMGYDEHGKKLHSRKVKPPKMTPMVVSRGTFTVDGVIGKAELNYDIADLKFLYLYVPGAGVTVVSNLPFAGATMQANAFDGQTLTVKAGEHTLQIAGDKRLLAEKKPLPAYVMLDRTFVLPSRYPVMGYGTVLARPFQWPGSKMNVAIVGVNAPPVPKNLEPKMLLAPCPNGQMRMPAPPVLPGQEAPAQPCVPLAQAEAKRVAMTKEAGAAKETVSAVPK